ncbi:hypothetical protein GCM10027048_34280 [Hymenobacter coalescens]
MVGLGVAGFGKGTGGGGIRADAGFIRMAHKEKTKRMTARPMRPLADTTFAETRPKVTAGRQRGRGAG